MNTLFIFNKFLYSNELEYVIKGENWRKALRIYISGKNNLTKHLLIIKTTITLKKYILGVVPLLWIHNICDRMGEERYVREIDYSFGAGTFI